ncbi:MAG: phenylalanine--tRNA ligase subunit alpha, partial [Verrucomicrobiota bacterium]
MNADLASIQSDALAAIAEAADTPSLEQAKIDFLGKKGRLSAANALMKDLSKEEKPAFGQALNTVRSAITSALDEKTATLQQAADLAAV